MCTNLALQPYHVHLLQLPQTTAKHVVTAADRFLLLAFMKWKVRLNLYHLVVSQSPVMRRCCVGSVGWVPSLALHGIRKQQAARKIKLFHVFRA